MVGLPMLLQATQFVLWPALPSSSLAFLVLKNLTGFPIYFFTIVINQHNDTMLSFRKMTYPSAFFCALSPELDR